MMKNKIKSIIALSHAFAKKYILQYFNVMKKPMIVGIIGYIFFALIEIHPNFAIGALLVTIPAIFYSFWRGFVITYALNQASCEFLKGNEQALPLLEIITINKTKEKEFARYIGLVALICTLIFLAIVFTAFVNIIVFLLEIIIFILISAPLLNFLTQAYFFKKENENFLKLYKNCFNIDKLGVIVILLIYFISTIVGLIPSLFASLFNSSNLFVTVSLNILNFLIGLVLFLGLNLYIYSINTFYFKTRIKD